MRERAKIIWILLGFHGIQAASLFVRNASQVYQTLLVPDQLFAYMSLQVLGQAPISAIMAKLLTQGCSANANI